jgi:glycosyltransferase involved in cell wall biosynthesis
VTFLPTCVPCGGAVAAHASNTARLVWIGSRSTLPSLFAAEQCLTAAQMRVPAAELRVVCNVFPMLDVVRVVPRVWSEETEHRELAEADIGVSWLPEHPWSLGKCGLKVLQYMAAGLPVIANPFGVHNELIEHGRTGFLARTRQEWADAVEQLSASPEMRREMGARGRRFVEKNYSVAARAADMIAALTDASAHAPLRTRAA